jgi:hypothetical protein
VIDGLSNANVVPDGVHTRAIAYYTVLRTALLGDGIDPSINRSGWWVSRSTGANQPSPIRITKLRLNPIFID